MTLIDYVNRVHFAENVLEEAVWAELESRGQATVGLISDRAHAGGELGERLRAALPHRARATAFEAAGSVPSESEARAIAAGCSEAGCGILLAYGPGEVINLAKATRLILGQGAPLARYAEEEGGGIRISGPLPDLIALPSLRGFCAGFNGILSIMLDGGRMVDIASRELTPSVTIGDPTVAANEPPEVRASTGVAAITLCVEALLSPHYNPPASGMALDGLNRALRSLDRAVAQDDPAARRELMAACMNAGMVEQTGLGLAHAMAASLCAVAHRGTAPCSVDKGAVKRLILPGTAGFHARSVPDDCAGLTAALGVSRPEDIAPRLSGVFRDLPLPGRLRELGLSEDQLDAAAGLALR
ncbi:MAG: iron-containing alcohol dehydrogenase, partial [Alphaproteobacteria bacterium]